MQLLIINCVIIIACAPKALSTVHLLWPLHNLVLQLLFTAKKESETFLLLPGKGSFAKMTNWNDKHMLSSGYNVRNALAASDKMTIIKA